MSKRFNVLIIEDLEDDAVLLVRELQRGKYDVIYERVDNASDLSIALESMQWDVILSDYSMPGFNALAALKLVQEKGIDAPFIIISGTVGEDIAVAALKAGAHDFLVKGKLARLIPTIEREMREADERSQRRWIQKELHQSEERFVKAFDASPIAISISSQTRNVFLDVNVQFLDFIGYSRQEVIGHSSVELGIWANPQDRAAVAQALNEQGTVRNWELKFRTKSGVLLDGLASFATIDLGDEPCVISMFQDVTERKRLHEELNQYAAMLEQRVLNRTAELDWAKRRVETILYYSSDAIILAGADGVIEQTNPGFYDLFGYETDEAFGLSLMSLIDTNDVEKLRQALNEVIQVRGRKRIEVICRRKNGTVLSADLSLAPLPTHNRLSPSVICSVRDISERKQLEQELRRALMQERELSELRSRFVSMASHDVRVPLTTILSSADILQRYYDRLDEVSRKSHFDKIHTQAGRTLALLNDLLTISRDDAGATPFNPTLITLHQFCQSVTEEFQSDPNLKHNLLFSSTGELTRVLADEMLLRQALTNLLTNAFKYSPEGSSVHFSLTFDNDHAMLRIQDSGIGIPEVDLPHLFEPFRRAGNVGKIEGTGLGLAIVKRSIDAHGGKITVESQNGVGTTFFIKIPLKSAAG